jgi:hypothetical protein
MAGVAQARGRYTALTASLLVEASAGDVSAVEAVLRQFGRADVAAAAKMAAGAALQASRWDNLAYLADFLHDADDDLVRQNSLGAGRAAAPVESDSVKIAAAPINVVPTVDTARRLLVGCIEEVTGTPLKEVNLDAMTDEMWGRLHECVRKTVIRDCITAVTGKAAKGLTASDVSESDRTKIADCANHSILSYVTLVESVGKQGGAPTRSSARASARTSARASAQSPARTSARTSAQFPVQSSAQFPVQSSAQPPARASARALVVSFAVVDDAPAGDDRPSPYVSIANPEGDIGLMRDADERVVDAPTIRVLYKYPLTTTGPTPEEEEAGGWIFEETAPNGKFFTRADLARAVAARYGAIYDEEAGTTTVEPGYIPGMINRNRTNGRYGIWGHTISDLALRAVERDPATGVFTLGIDY